MRRGVEGDEMLEGVGRLTPDTTVRPPRDWTNDSVHVPLLPRGLVRILPLVTELTAGRTSPSLCVPSRPRGHLCFWTQHAFGESSSWDR